MSQVSPVGRLGSCVALMIEKAVITNHAQTTVQNYQTLRFVCSEFLGC